MAKAKAPKYVRLVPRLTNALIADVEGRSGWSCSGLDVKEFPGEDADPAARRFVTNALREGKLIAATKGEFDLVQKITKEAEELNETFQLEGGTVAHQESRVQTMVRKRQRELVKLFEKNDGADADEDGDNGSELTQSKLNKLSAAAVDEEAEKLGIDPASTKAETIELILAKQAE